MHLELARARKSEFVSLAARLNGLVARLFAPVDIASIVLFRIAFGAVMLWEVTRYFTYGWISSYYIEPSFHFTYYGFDWVKPWPGQGMYYHFGLLGVLAFFIIIGFMYRISTTLFFLGFSYVFLLDQARYLNHFYLVALISFLMIFIPAHRAFSVDSLIRPALSSDTVPVWALWLIRAQIALPYVFGGIAKLNEDWLRGEPIRSWLAGQTDFPIIGRFFTDDWMVYLFSYGGLMLDLFVVPALLWRRTRPFALVAAFTFHLLNNSLFEIGIFPWFMMAGTIMFLPPNWPRVLLPPWSKTQAADITGPVALDRLRNFLATLKKKKEELRPYPQTYTSRQQYVILGLLGLYMAFQVLMPLRHFFYPGEVAWTDEGHRFSWRMKLRDKQADAQFFVTNPATGHTWPILERAYLEGWQSAEMETRPDMILQFAHHVADQLKQKGYGQIEVRAHIMASLNGRPEQLLIDPNIDLVKQPRTIMPTSWILPLDKSAGDASSGEK